MQTVVTGVAGFIGSHVAEELLRRGHRVRGVDCFTPYYDVGQKRDNVAQLRRRDRFSFVEADLRTTDLAALLDDADAVFHLAAQPGVRDSWQENFRLYQELNVLATQRVLEAARQVGRPRVVYASSSSVYGNAERYPTRESDLPRPYSPYGVTKMAAEHLCCLYAENFEVPTVSLRYFTVYGPRQRPEMAMNRLIATALGDGEFTLFGSGDTVRDFTFVADAAAATVAAGVEDVPPGMVLNVASGQPTTLDSVIDAVGDAAGAPVPVVRRDGVPGDVDRTGAVTERANDVLGWKPQVSLREGLDRQVAWQRHRLA